VNDDLNSLSGAEPAVSQASDAMRHGISLLDESTPASLKKSIGFFDEAIKLRSGLALGGNPVMRYGLAGSWMNRGDALRRLGSGENLDEALRSYDAALEFLRGLPLDAAPHFRHRLAIAWQNRGLVLHAQGRAATVAEACRSFEAALDVLRPKCLAPALGNWNDVLAVAWMNYGNALVWGKTRELAAKARVAAKQALAFASPVEAQDSMMADASLKARCVLCRALSVLLPEKNQPDLEKDELLAEATDTVDAGMALARNWEQRGARQFRSLARELFRFGARTYQAFQPHFLNEFLLENLDPAISPGAFSDDSEMHAAALESLWREFREIQRGGFGTSNTPQSETFWERLRELRMGEDRLAELRQLYVEPRPGVPGNPGTSGVE
jgi:tetratricopeptide (TPR) repeat protein